MLITGFYNIMMAVYGNRYHKYNSHYIDDLLSISRRLNSKIILQEATEKSS